MVRALIGDILAGKDGAAKQDFSVESQLRYHSTYTWICIQKTPKAAGNPVFTVEASDVKKLPGSTSAPASYRQSTTDHITLAGNNIFPNTEGLSTVSNSHLFQQLVQLH